MTKLKLKLVLTALLAYVVISALLAAWAAMITGLLLVTCSWLIWAFIRFDGVTDDHIDEWEKDHWDK